MNQSSYPMPQGQVQPSPHVPGGPGGALPPPGMGGPAPYGPGPYGSAYNSGYNSSNMVCLPILLCLGCCAGLRSMVSVALVLPAALNEQSRR